MHEMAYVRNVVDTVNKYAEKENVAEVKAVYLTCLLYTSRCV